MDQEWIDLKQNVEKAAYKNQLIKNNDDME